MIRLVVACLVVASVAARAEPVRDDIVDLRHGRSPNRRVVLGWTADDRVVVHVASCGVNDAGGPFCASSLEVSGPRGTARTTILQPACAPCDPSAVDVHYEVPTAVASKAIRTAAKALAALGPLRASEARTAAVGVTHSTCRAEVAIAGASFDLGQDCIAEGGSSTIRSARVRDVQRSPDGRWLAITLALDIQWLEWTDPIVVVTVVPAPR